MRRALVALLWLAGSAPLLAGDHVRVVLDLSQSMQRNDPHRLAILATELLFDLAAPNPTLDDSFVILPFDPAWSWARPDDPPPKATRPPIVVGHEQRDALARELASLAYDARMTYFYPGLQAAIADLERTPGGDRDTRTVVLITDGVPERPTREREGERIRSELVPRLEKHGIRLYVLAFSAEALAHRDFLEAMVRGPAGALGEVFLDPDGSRLLAHMLSLFGHSFGYGSTSSRVGETRDLDLESGSRPSRVAVVVHVPRPTPATLRLTHPPGGALNAPDGVVTAHEKSDSYSLVWVLSPSPGRYAFASDGSEGEVAVLRPAELDLEVLPAPPHQQSERTMAETPFPLRVRVRSRTGSGDPGPLDLSFRPLGARLPDGPDGPRHAWRGDRGAPSGPGTPTPEGRVYDLSVVFERNRDDAGVVYAGSLELEARRGAALVGSRVGEHAHRVEVHPHLAIAPLPLEAYVADHALGRYGEGCVRFSLTLAAGELPHPDQPRYSLRARLAPRDPEVADRELRHALFTLDGVAVPISDEGAGAAVGWAEGRKLDRDALLASHELCVRMGEPTAGDAQAPLELPLELTLLEAPYDDFGVVAPFRAKLLVAPPPPFDAWRPLLLVGALALAVAAALWYLRQRPALPDDLRYALGRDAASLEPRMPGPISPLRRWLGLAGARPLANDAGNVFAMLVPATDGLFCVRPAVGVSLHSEDGNAIPVEAGGAAVEVHRLYRLAADGGSQLFRLEYDPGEGAGSPRGNAR